MKPLRITTALAAAIMTAVMLSPTVRAQQRIEVRWAELPQVLDGRVVSAVLVDGAVLRGRVLDVSATEARFEVKKTSDRNLYPKGEGSVTREQLSAFSYRDRRGHWRAAGTAIGGGAGAVPAVLLCGLRSDDACSGGYQNSDKMAAAAAAMVGVGAVVGYLAGHAADLHETIVVVAKN